jgi:zinc D-Ala-D-Ala carboxypeptidase
VNNAGSPKPKETNRLSKYSASYHDDIAQAQRDGQDEPRASKRPKWLGLAIAGCLAALFPILFFSLRPQTPIAQPSPTAVASAPATKPTAAPSISVSPSPEELLGHRRYDEAPQSELEEVADGIRMRKAAAVKFRAMMDAAQADGVNLFPISGFRTNAEQNQLFFEVSAERAQSATTRSDVSAPPGYSEHHTGYATDIGDGAQPDTNLSQSFDETAAFKWLTQNAPRYNFELSFKKGNPEKVSYEPWHWRFVGDRKSLETFYRDKKK